MFMKTTAAVKSSSLIIRFKRKESVLKIQYAFLLEEPNGLDATCKNNLCISKATLTSSLFTITFYFKILVRI